MEYQSNKNNKSKCTSWQCQHFPLLEGVLDVKYASRTVYCFRLNLRWLGHLVRMPPGRLPGEVPGTSHWEETPGKTQDTLERLCLSAGLGTPRGPPGRAGGSGRGQGCLGFSAQADPTPGEAVDNGWMDLICHRAAALFANIYITHPTHQCQAVISLLLEMQICRKFRKLI